MNPYWRIVQQRAAEYSLAHSRPAAPLTAGLPVLAAHAADFSPFHTLHVAQMCLSVIVFEDCPGHLRTPAGVPDLARLVPGGTDVLTILTTAEEQHALFGRGLAAELHNVEDQVAATTRARNVVQRLLDQVPHGPGGRQRMLDIVWELRDDPRAMAGVIALTAAALREVATQQGPVDVSTRQ
ncbi:hypothetical protein ACFV4E_15385 [Streptomyces hygroscopicus]|uniref:Uncharacterized protein n=1 Tax=Streptomyces demainii TaxID=588122 RepID=A0ABT9KHM6_9ACTN|nr:MULTISPECIES: hypothetical protein [Streptomyces]MDP9607904.1 hypothetical protein [Streptomyces demainii]